LAGPSLGCSDWLGLHWDVLTGWAFTVDVLTGWAFTVDVLIGWAFTVDVLIGWAFTGMF
jgi:hypothetical protein